MVDEPHARFGLAMVTRTCLTGQWYLVGSLFEEISMR